MKKLESLKSSKFAKFEKDMISGQTVMGGYSLEIGTCSSKCADISKDGEITVVGCIDEEQK